MTDPFFRSGVSGVDRMTFDVGLRSYMQSVFAYMGGGLALTGVVAWIVAHTALAALLFGSPLRWLVVIAPVGFVMVINLRIQTITASGLKTMFWLFCATMGLSMGSLFLTYTDASIARVFFITAADFGAMALWGYTTKRDLTGMGAFMLMGMIGLIIASVVNLFMMSSMLQWMLSVAGVAIFTGLTAWNMQRIKQSYAESYGVEANEKMAVFGALSLYMDFINLFYLLMNLMGTTRRN